MSEEIDLEEEISILQYILDLRKSSAPLVRVFPRFWGDSLYYCFIVGVGDLRLAQNLFKVRFFDHAVLVAKAIAFVFGARYEELKDFISYYDFLEKKYSKKFEFGIRSELPAKKNHSKNLTGADLLRNRIIVKEESDNLFGGRLK